MVGQNKVFFLIPYPLHEAPSQRFRFEQYFHVLDNGGLIYSVQSFFTKDNWRSFYGSGKVVQKTTALMLGFAKRILALPRIIKYDFIFIHREAAPIGPPVLEWIIAKVLRKRIIYDFDDAIWLTDRKEESILLRVAKWRRKAQSICSWSYKVSCGNEYLCAYALKFNHNVVYNPTTIDTEQLHKAKLHSIKAGDRIIIGWTGSHSTLKYLNAIKPILQHLENKFPQVEFLVIADKPPELKLKRLRYKPWSLESEIADLAAIDIGVMPLPDDEWTKGKCGFKALQYMALGVPAVVSPVGVNIQIIKDGKNGFLCSTEGEWINRLEFLINDREARKKIGNEGRATVEMGYSVLSNLSNFLCLFS